jgi:hypothetical protein
MITYERLADEDLLRVLDRGGFAHSLVDFAKSGQYALDLQMRGYAAKSNETWASLYVGLTKVLDLRHLPSKGFRLRVDKTWATPQNHWKTKWASEWRDEEWMEREWPDVEAYLERVIPAIPKNYLIEGAVQSAISGFNNDKMLIIDREAAVCYQNQSEKDLIKSKLEPPLLNAMKPPGDAKWWGTVPRSLGGECDALAISDKGDLLAIEIKPRTATGTIRWSPLQVRYYADLFSEWVNAEHGVGEGMAANVIERMVEQRIRLGLIQPERRQVLKLPIKVQPVIAVGRYLTDAALSGLREVQGRLSAAGRDDPPVILKLATLWGQLEDVDV